MKNYKYYEIDGKENGFAILKPDIDILFSSLELAKIYCLRNSISNPEYGIYMKDLDAYVRYSDVEDLGLEHFYEWYDLDNIRTIFHVKQKRKIASIGYLVFKDGDSGEFINEYKIGRKENKKLFASIYDMICKLSSVASVRVYKYKDFIDIKQEDTTAVLTISCVPHMLWLNNQRNMYGEDNYHKRAFPYMKNMDRWISFYTYISIDMNEKLIYKGEEQIALIRSKIMEYLNDLNDPDMRVRYVPVKYNGLILV